MAPKAEQILALLSGYACELVEAQCPRPSIDSYAELLTVTRSDIDQYVAKHGFPDGAVLSRPGKQDGVYMIRQKSGYSVYYQEQQIGTGHEIYSSKDEAEHAVTTWLLGLSGTGLTF